MQCRRQASARYQDSREAHREGIRPLPILLSDHFTDDEFRCPCGRPECDAPKRPAQALISALEILRARVDHPLRVTSGIRCTTHNAKVGGENPSAHLTGEAADLACPDSGYRWRLLECLFVWPELFFRVGIGSTFVHVDVSQTLPGRVVWAYYGPTTAR